MVVAMACDQLEEVSHDISYKALYTLNSEKAALSA
jgi:hypothetical protein